ncbi:hypothetical protein GOODEAATRI_029835 [Goodea atripinnis]|uniref:Uncharacterized protein n=1 Tax=Goodea atripinnis TaxID=208336 RepID=A0ABV0Q2W9_9TELE
MLQCGKPFGLTDFSCTCHKVSHAGGRSEFIFDPTQPYGPNMVSQIQSMWRRNACRCRRLVSRGVFLAVHVESFILANGAAIFAHIHFPEERENEDCGGGGGQ